MPVRGQPPAHRRNPPVPNTDHKSMDDAQVKLIEAAGQVLLDQGWHVLVAGGLKIIQHETGERWLCIKFTGRKRDSDQVSVLSQETPNPSRKRRTKSDPASRVAPKRKAR